MEAELSWNIRVSAVRVELTEADMHTHTRESQEVLVGLIVTRWFPIEFDVANVSKQSDVIN